MEVFLKTEKVTKDDLMSVFNTLQDEAERLFIIDEKIEVIWLEIENFDETEFASETDLTEDYRDKCVSMKAKVDLNLARIEKNEEILDSLNETKRNFRLPKLELKRFDGNIKNWLGFWGQFNKIHEDNSIDSDNKFQYLLQATEIGTSARDLVESFPPSGTNYYKAVEQLKSRFAKDELLIQIYVRELLNLVLTQAKSVESALPEDLIKEWERTRSKVDDKDDANILSSLLGFLRSEVESEERLQLARSGFGRNQELPMFAMRDKIPTASCIVASEKK
ncbi:uncharacterized protein [Parasteatoda tepidariorum]|uniref:uncharacterized protein n=1 Tax=Parasteatoda tepidariorum TaxID=114398 RepID=UPI0039BC48A3